MELLIVGAGAVGSVYGYFASRHPGPETIRVTYLIKPKHREDLANGIRLYHWKGRHRKVLQFKTFSLIDSLEEVAKRSFDAVLLTLPSDKMREEGWLDALLKVTKNAKIWSLQPNPGDRLFIRKRMELAGIADIDSKLIFGGIPILSYLAPMPGEAFSEPGYAFYIPPTSKAAWSSRISNEAEKVARLFNRAGFPSRVTPESDTSGLLPESLLRCLVAGLEQSEWSFSRLLHGANLPLIQEGIREMTAILAKLAGVKDPGRSLKGKLLTTSLGMRSAIRAARLIMPFDFESFLRVHFTKVEGQMHLALDEMIDTAEKIGLPFSTLKLLRGRQRKS